MGYLNPMVDFSVHDLASLRTYLVPQLRATLDKGYHSAERQLLTEHHGLNCAQSLSRLMDETIADIYKAVITHLYPLHHGSDAEVLAVIATGGYGRGAMAPGSDVDLLFLLPYKQTAWGESVVEAMLYILWDLKLKIGHATRSVDECLHEAKQDMTTRTALLDARFLLGEAGLYMEMNRRFRNEVLRGTSAMFVDAKLKERDKRIARVGISRYLVEPNVKDGKGGLRDLNTLSWIVNDVFNLRELDEWVATGIITAQEAQRFQRCEEYLWRVRCHLHFLSKRAEERLTFDVQRGIAERIGYADRAGLSAVERFMKAYFLVAKMVGDLTASICAALEERQAKQSPMLDRVRDQWLRWRNTRLESPSFFIDNERINIINADVFEANPLELIRLFWLASKHNLPIHPEALQLVARSLKLINADLRENKEANHQFLDILTAQNSETILRHMNEAGVLGRFVPEFARVVAMMQFNMYHHYTVDEHLLRSVGVLSGLEAGQLANEHPLASRVFQTIQNRRALYVALFLHDIGKGRPEDHSIAGARIAKKLAPRFGLTPVETDHVVWLVENHLVMSMMAQGRDLSDPKTIESFVHIVQTMERLKLLVILTIADIRAVGPGVWTGWKGELLRTLYYETEMVLGGSSEVSKDNRIIIAQEKLFADLQTWTPDEFQHYVARLPSSYWFKVDPLRRLRQAQFLKKAEASKVLPAHHFSTDKFRAISELTLLAPDHPRLLSIITGACAASGANIVDAQIFTTLDGMALDTIILSRSFDEDRDEERRSKRIAAAIEMALKGEVKIADLVDAKKKQKKRSNTFDVTGDVIIDNSLSSRHTVLEITGLDRPGLLYDLTMTLGQLNLNIASAHISTFGEKVVDVFYVTDLEGQKIITTIQQEAIRQALMNNIGQR